MPLSSRLAPGFLRIRYTGATRPHTCVLPIKFAAPPVPGVEPVFSTTGATEKTFSEAVADFIGAYNESFDDVTKFGFAEAYSVDPVTGIRTFIWAEYLDGSGTALTARVPLVQAVWVFKTTAGKMLKIYAMEGVYTADVRNIGILPADGRKVLSDYILSTENVVYGREDAWPLAFVSFTSKENDVLRRNGLVTT